MTIYEQIDKMLSQDSDRPKWVDEILFELKEIKYILKNSSKTIRKPQKDKAYFEFVNVLREKMRASITDGKYPEIYYQKRTLGINFKGWIYDKETSDVLPSYKAFEVYKFLYNQKENIDKFLKL